MAYTLKASGLATNLIACVAVDQDGTTIKDFVGSAITLGTGVAASVSTATWKGVSRGTFATTANGSFNFHGVTWNTPPSVVEDDADGMSVFAAFAGSSANSNNSPWVQIGAGNTSNTGLAAVTGKATYSVSGGTRAQTTTNIPTDGTTKFAVGVTYRSGASSAALYGLESGSMSQEASAGSDGGFGGSRTLHQLGGAAGNGNQPARYFIACVFNRILTTAEMQSLHDDWFGVLFDAPVGTVLSAPTVVSTGNGIATVRVTTDTPPSGSSTLAVRTRAAAAPAWTAPEVLASPTATLTSGASGARDFSLTGLTNGTALVADFAQTGPSNVVSTASFTPSTVPGAPTIGTATAGNAQATVNGTAPASNGGAAITGYRSTATPGGSTVTGATLPITHTGLTNGTAYTFTLAAQNTRGYGAESAASNSVTPTPGGTAPTITVQPANQTVTAGATAGFSVTATGSGLTYQWRRNGTPIGGATSSSYTTPATTVSGGSANNGDLYSVVVTGDTAPAATSNNATLTVNAGSPPPPPPPSSGHDVGPIFNNTYAAPLEGTTVHFSWYANGRIGSLTGITPTEGTGVVGSDGMLAIAPSGAGCVFVAKRNAGATTDDVFYQAFAS